MKYLINLKKIFFIALMISSTSLFANNLPQGFLPTAITSNNGRYILSGFNQAESLKTQIYTSVDAESWSPSQIKINLFAFATHSIACNNQNICVAAGDENNSSGIILYSKNNGATWNVLANTNPGITEEFTNVTYGNGVFILLTHEQTNPPLYSTDGVNWNSVNFPLTNNSFVLNSVAFGNGNFELIGQTISNNSASNSIVLNSKDGIDWQLQNIPYQISSDLNIDDVVYSNEMFIINSDYESELYTTSDGINFNEISEPGPIGNFQAANDVIFGSMLYTGVPVVSTNGITWSSNLNFDPILPNGSTIYSLTYNNGSYVAIGISVDQNGNLTTLIYKSVDGINWNAL